MKEYLHDKTEFALENDVAYYWLPSATWQSSNKWMFITKKYLKAKGNSMRVENQKSFSNIGWVIAF